MNGYRHERARGVAPALRRVALISLAAAVAAGCATVGPRAEDAGDVCWSQRTELRGAQDYYARAVVEGAAMGAALGGLAGLVTGQSARSVAIGATAGAVAGGIGGYYMAKQRVATDAATLSASVYQDVIGANQQIDRATVAFAKLRDCRYAAAGQIKADWRAGRINRQEAQTRLAEQRRRFDEDLRIADEVGAKMGERAREYRYAADELERQSPSPAATRTKGRAAAGTGTVAAATQTNQIKQRAFTDDVQVAKTKAPAVFALEGQVGMTAPICPLPGAA
jgi:hypothetical protein